MSKNQTHSSVKQVSVFWFNSVRVLLLTLMAITGVWRLIAISNDEFFSRLLTEYSRIPAAGKHWELWPQIVLRNLFIKCRKLSGPHRRMAARLDDGLVAKIESLPRDSFTILR